MERTPQQIQALAILLRIRTRLRQEFGEDGKAELRITLLKTALPCKPENLAREFQRYGWTVNLTEAPLQITFTFANPPPDELALSPNHRERGRKLIQHITRVTGRNTPGTLVKVPLPQTPYRVLASVQEFLAQNGTASSLEIDASGRITHLLVQLPEDPSRASRPPAM